MDSGAVFRRTAATVNTAVLPALRTALGRRLLGAWFAQVTYRGRRSGREVTLPVNYRRDGDDVVIGVVAPDAKRWWRNFLGEGSPVHLTLGSTEVDGHAVATRDASGRVTVRVTPGPAG